MDIINKLFDIAGNYRCTAIIDEIGNGMPLKFNELMSDEEVTLYVQSKLEEQALIEQLNTTQHDTARQ